jgi:hypothetical protein
VKLPDALIATLLLGCEAKPLPNSLLPPFEVEKEDALFLTMNAFLMVNASSSINEPSPKFSKSSHELTGNVRQVFQKLWKTGNESMKQYLFSFFVNENVGIKPSSLEMILLLEDFKKNEFESDKIHEILKWNEPNFSTLLKTIYKIETDLNLDGKSWSDLDNASQYLSAHYLYHNDIQKFSELSLNLPVTIPKSSLIILLSPLEKGILPLEIRGSLEGLLHFPIGKNKEKIWKCWIRTKENPILKRIADEAITFVEKDFLDKVKFKNISKQAAYKAWLKEINFPSQMDEKKPFITLFQILPPRYWKQKWNLNDEELLEFCDRNPEYFSALIESSWVWDDFVFYEELICFVSKNIQCHHLLNIFACEKYQIPPESIYKAYKKIGKVGLTMFSYIPLLMQSNLDPVWASGFKKNHGSFSQYLCDIQRYDVLFIADPKKQLAFVQGMTGGKEVIDLKVALEKALKLKHVWLKSLQNHRTLPNG